MIDTTLTPTYFFRIDGFEYSPSSKVHKSRLEELAMSLVKIGESVC
jgi:hypothetical protein